MDLTPLLAGLEAAGVYPLHSWPAEGDGLWYATLTTDEQYEEPEATIGAMLDAVEALSAGLARRWRGATLREFNIGYRCGFSPWAFNQGLKVETLRRLARARGTLRFTLYPPEGKRVGGTSKGHKKRRRG